MKVKEVLIEEITFFYLKNNTLDGHYLVFYSPNLDNLCPEIEKRLAVQLTASDDVDLCLLKFETYEEALQSWHMVADLDISAEIWVGGKRKKKAKVLKY